jgi:hypothetical protein
MIARNFKETFHDLSLEKVIYACGINVIYIYNESVRIVEINGIEKYQNVSK